MIGSGQKFGGPGRVGSQEMEPWTVLISFYRTLCQTVSIDYYLPSQLAITYYGSSISHR